MHKAIFDEILDDPSILDSRAKYGGIECKISEFIKHKLHTLPEGKLDRIKTKIDALPQKYAYEKLILYELGPFNIEVQQCVDLETPKLEC